MARSETNVGQQGVQELDSRKGEVEIKAEGTLYTCPVFQQPNSIGIISVQKLTIYLGF